jgi:hypothetical protein
MHKHASSSRSVKDSPWDMQAATVSNFFLSFCQEMNSQTDDFTENGSISRLQSKKQSLDDMYSVPANFLEIDVMNPQTTIVQGKKKFTDYEIKMKVSEVCVSYRSKMDPSENQI